MLFSFPRMYPTKFLNLQFPENPVTLLPGFLIVPEKDYSRDHATIAVTLPLVGLKDGESAIVLSVLLFPL